MDVQVQVIMTDVLINNTRLEQGDLSAIMLLTQALNKNVKFNVT